MVRAKRKSAGGLFKNRVKRDGKTIEYPNWYGRYKDEFGNWQKVKLFTDRDASNIRLQEIIRDVERRAVGIHTPDMDHAGKPISEHVAAYLDNLKLENRDDQHQRIARWMLDKLILMGGWKRIGDITGDSLRTILMKLHDQGKTTSYQNKFVMRAKAFVHWLQREKRLTADPLANIKKAQESTAKKTRGRRALSDNEVAALMASVPNDRKLKYAVPLLAGFRRSEFADLLWGDLRLNAPRPFVKLRPEQTKNRKSDVLPLHPYLVLLLSAMTPGAADEPVIASVPDMKTMAKDLLAAGVAHEVPKRTPGCITLGKGKTQRFIDIADKRGLRADFHSLRHTFCTNLEERTGCSETTRKSLMRHSHEGVTAGYSHARTAELFAAIDKLPVPWLTQASEAQAQIATGTDGKTDDFRWTNVGQEAPTASDDAGRHWTINASSDDAGNGAALHVRSSPDNELATASDSTGQHRTKNHHNSFSNKDLRPSTQVD